MLFNSLAFLFFFPIVIILYWLLPLKIRKEYLLLVSFYFYANWEPIFLFLLLYIISLTYCISIDIEKYITKRKLLLTIGIIGSLLPLFFFKYLNFVSVSINCFLTTVNLKIQIPHFELLLPVGISFFTFMAIGYMIDVYRGKIDAEHNLLDYSLFISFFPQIAAGPIGRANQLIPQFKFLPKFNQDILIEGLKMIIWGYFIKLCIADRVSPYVDAIFGNYYRHTGKSMFLACFLYTFQIFGDFAGYSLLSIGTAKCMNIHLMENFHRPYLSTSMNEFWKRWHISLSSWFMEYVYFPIGGSRCGFLKTLRNLMITMLVSGLWHGANWTFVIWGAYHGVLLCLLKVKKKYLPDRLIWSKGQTLFNIMITFFCSMIGWVLFRASNISEALYIITHLVKPTGMLFNGDGKPNQLLGLLCISLLIFKEVKDEKEWNVHFMHHRNLYVSTFWMAAMIAFILLVGVFDGGQFIYFQF